MSKVRVRFAPSPTGALHIGGVRTALFNYLFAKANSGDFVLRIEDTDQTRFVEGAEDYINASLNWLGIIPDEGAERGGSFGPYRQSDRKELYKEYVEKLLREDKAYYAFDTPDELEAMRERLKSERILNPQYDAFTRMTMKNSLTLSEKEVEERINSGEPYVVRIKIPTKEEVRLEDLVRGWVKVQSETLDDKVLMKSDGMPTYHLANVVDDHLMEITHVIRGEEWLPSAPLHVLLYKFLGWESSTPRFAHLPLILKPDGNGKLSKRAADKAGFPIFPLNWKDPSSEEETIGFKETGFLPAALTNFLAFLGWNPGTEQELFTLNELIEAFSLDRVNKAGTKFDFDKAKWFNQEYIKVTSDTYFGDYLAGELKAKYEIECPPSKAKQIANLLKGRISFPNEMVDQSLIFFVHPKTFDEKVVRKKWNDSAAEALQLFTNRLNEKISLIDAEVKDLFWTTLEQAGHKPGQYMQLLRLCLTGEGSGPDLMKMIEIMGPAVAKDRINHSIELLSNH